MMKSPLTAITGIGILTPTVGSFEMLSDAKLPLWTEGTCEVQSVPLPEGQREREFRRLSKLARMAAYTSDQALRMSRCSTEGMGLGVALTHGSSSYLTEFHDLLFKYGPDGASPGAFSNGVTNAPLSTVSSLYRLTEGGITLIGLEHTGLELLSHAAISLQAQEYSSFLAGAAEEYSSVVAGVYKRLGWYTGGVPEYLPMPDCGSGFGVSEGSAFAVLEPLTKESRMRALCTFRPVDPDDIICTPDYIISGAGGGPQDRYELEVLKKVVAAGGDVLFTKQLFGECFALGSLLAAVVACSLLAHGEHGLPSVQVNSELKISKTGECGSVLVIAAGRDSQIAAGLFESVDRESI